MSAIQEIPVGKIFSNFNSRARESELDVSGLMDSIKRQGLLQPIGVIKSGEKYKLVFGHRRLMAVRKLGKPNISAIILDDKKDAELVECNLVENLQRQDLTVFEYGQSISLLLKKHKLNSREISKRIGISETLIRHYVAIYEKTPLRFRDKVINPTGKGKRPLKYVTLTQALFLCNIRKASSLSSVKRSSLWDYCYNNQVRIDELKTIAKDYETEPTIDACLKKQSTKRTIHITIALSQDRYDLAIKKYSKIGIRQLLSERMLDQFNDLVDKKREAP